MKNLSLPLLCLVVLSLSACQTSSLTQDEKVSAPETSTPFSGVLKGIDMTQSHISFVGKSNIVNHEGKFTTYSAHVTLDSAEPSNLEKATIDATIDVASVKTDADGLNGHLQKEDFFDAEQFPTVSFVSTNILSKKDANQYEVTGNLTIKGTTKVVTFDAEITDDYLVATYDLPRLDFGIGNESYGNKFLEPTVPVNVKMVFLK